MANINTTPKVFIWSSGRHPALDQMTSHRQVEVHPKVFSQRAENEVSVLRTGSERRRPGLLWRRDSEIKLATEDEKIDNVSLPEKFVNKENLPPKDQKLPTYKTYYPFKSLYLEYIGSLSAAKDYITEYGWGDFFKDCIVPVLGYSHLNLSLLGQKTKELRSSDLEGTYFVKTQNRTPYDAELREADIIYRIKSTGEYCIWNENLGAYEIMGKWRIKGLAWLYKKKNREQDYLKLESSIAFQKNQKALYLSPMVKAILEHAGFDMSLCMNGSYVLIGTEYDEVAAELKRVMLALNEEIIKGIEEKKISETQVQVFKVFFDCCLSISDFLKPFLTPEENEILDEGLVVGVMYTLAKEKYEEIYKELKVLNENAAS